MDVTSNNLETLMDTALNPARILQTGLAFRSSKVLLTAVGMNLFTMMGDQRLTAEAIGSALGLHPRGLHDFLDTLVALEFLNREGDGPDAVYQNSEESSHFLDRNRPSYIGGILDMCNSRLYGHWDHLTEALKTGLPQSELHDANQSPFEVLYADEDRLEQFMQAMSSVQRGNFTALANRYDFSRHRILCDLGGAAASLSLIVAKHYPHLQCVSFDLPVVKPIAQRNIDRSGFGDRVTAVVGDFFVDHLPQADVITMGNILHDWGLDKKRFLIQRVYDTLPEGGAFIVVENIIDDARRQNAFGLLMSLNMLIETGEGFDFTGKDFSGWCEEAGFRRTEIIPLIGPGSAAIAIK